MLSSMCSPVLVCLASVYTLRTVAAAAAAAAIICSVLKSHTAIETDNIIVSVSFSDDRRYIRLLLIILTRQQIPYSYAQ